VRVAFIAVAVALGAYAVYVQRSAIATGLSRLGAPAVLGALLAVVVGLAASMQVWRVLLASLGSPLPVPVAARIFFLGQLGKYIPGSMWPVLAQMELAKAQRVPRDRSATASVLTMIITLCGGLLAAVITLPLLSTGTTAAYRWVLLAAPLLLAALHPRVLNPALARLLRLARRPALEHRLSGATVIRAIAWSWISWVLLGAHVYLLAITVGASAGRAALVAIGGFAFAWSAGFLVVFAPAGAGVRELILVGALGTVLDTGTATAIALVSRVLMTVGDLLIALLAALLAARSRAGAGGGEVTSSAAPGPGSAAE
jgi:glycosyltransferase 2 family protein